ncbi:hypothetical protein Tco_0994038 [Tanacetum coccineum]
MEQGLTQGQVIVGVSHDLRGDSCGYVPQSLFLREDLDRDGERGFDHLTFALVSSKAHREGVAIRVVDSHAGNHPEGGFTPFKTIRRLLVVIGRRSHSGFEGETFKPERRCCGLSVKELNEFLSSYPIPSEYDVILSKSTQTIFDAPPGYVGFVRVFDDPILFLVGLKPSWEFDQQRSAIIRWLSGTLSSTEMAFRNFIYTGDDDDLPPKDVEEPEVQPAKVTADSRESPKADVFVAHLGNVAARIRKHKTRGGSLRPPMKRKLASGLLTSRVVRAKTSASKDDAPFLSISDDEGLPDCFELKDANACHLKISAITPPAWKGHLDNQMDLELLDLHDRCYARQAVVDNAVNRRAREFLQVIEKMSGEADVIKARERSREEECEGLRVKCEAAMAEFDQNPAVLALREKISSLTADVKEHKGNLDRMMLESQKWAGYQVTLSTLESKVNSLEADKARLEAVEASLRREVEELKRVGKLVSSAIIYGRCRAYEQVVAMKEPFDLSKAKGYCSSYQKDHTQASNDFATATFPWLDEFVADATARFVENLIVEEASHVIETCSFKDPNASAFFLESYSILCSIFKFYVSSC